MAEPRRQRRDRDGGYSDLQERVVEINRVAKVVKGGRRFSFTALVVVGDEKSQVGVGYGKANEVPLAIQKAVERAKKNLYKVPMHGTTITHQTLGRSEEHTSELQSRQYLVCRLLLEKKKTETDIQQLS